jgi:predicted GIY-YIG superfamily endonuclease
MYYVYIIQSKVDDRLYVGFSTDLKKRIKAHNFGQSIHTAKYKPWALVFYSSFCDIKTAKEFEQYLKSHSGRIFLNKRLVA